MDKKGDNWIKGINQFKNVIDAKITNGYGGVMMQTVNGDIYTMEKNSKLMVLRNNSNLAFAKTDETAKGKNDGTINIINFASHYSKLQYKKVETSTWNDVDDSGLIENLVSSNYQFQWTSKNGEEYEGIVGQTQAIPNIIQINSKIPIPTNYSNFY